MVLARHDGLWIMGGWPLLGGRILGHVNFGLSTNSVGFGNIEQAAWQLTYTYGVGEFH